LDNIINIQRPYYDAFGLGYNQTQIEKGSSSKMTKREEKTRNYVEAVRGPSKEENRKNQEEDCIYIAPPRRFINQY